MLTLTTVSPRPAALTVIHYTTHTNKILSWRRKKAVGLEIQQQNVRMGELGKGKVCGVFHPPPTFIADSQQGLCANVRKLQASLLQTEEGKDQ